MNKQFIEMFGKGEPILKSEVPVIYRSKLDEGETTRQLKELETHFITK